MLLLHATGGGTGSAYADTVIEKFQENDAKAKLMSYTIWPSPNISTSVLEPYNSSFSIHRTLVERIKYCVVFDNEKLYKICDKKLGLHNPTYADINSIIAQHLSSLTATMRFGG